MDNEEYTEDAVDTNDSLRWNNEYQCVEKQVMDLRFAICDYTKPNDTDLFYYFDFHELALFLYSNEYLRYAYTTEEKMFQL
jgi:hypothetical protein